MPSTLVLVVALPTRVGKEFILNFGLTPTVLTEVFHDFSPTPPAKCQDSASD
jgi:hypothetical protein